jgi:hypothetical protein
VVKTNSNAIFTGPRSKKRREEKRREKRNKKHPKVIPFLYLVFLTHAPLTIVTVARISA